MNLCQIGQSPPPPHLCDFLILSPGAYLLPGSESSIMWDDIFLNYRYEWRIIKLLKSCPALSPRAYRMTCRKCELSSPGSASREPRETILRTMRRPCPPNTSCSWLSRGRPLTICCLSCCVGGYRATNGLPFICLGLFLFWKKTFVGERDWHLKSPILSNVRFWFIYVWQVNKSFLPEFLTTLYAPVLTIDGTVLNNSNCVNIMIL